jgi:phage terminase large subunit-like protein
LDVEETIRQACKAFKVAAVHCDSHRWQRSLQLLADERLPMIDFPQSSSRMIPATKRLTDAVKNKLVTHSGDPRLRRHVGNAVLKVDSRGATLRKSSDSSPRKIDLAVCAVMAFDKAQEVKKRVRPQFFDWRTI